MNTNTYQNRHLPNKVPNYAEGSEVGKSKCYQSRSRISEDTDIYLFKGVLVAVRVSQRDDDPVNVLGEGAVGGFSNELIDNVDGDRSSDPFSGVDHSVDDDDRLHEVLETGRRDAHELDLATFVAETGVDNCYEVGVGGC